MMDTLIKYLLDLLSKTKPKRKTMIKDLLTFKENPYTSLSTIAQIMAALMTTIEVDKFVNGDTDRNAALDALSQLILSHKS